MIIVLFLIHLEYSSSTTLSAVLNSLGWKRVAFVFSERKSSADDLVVKAWKETGNPMTVLFHTTVDSEHPGRHYDKQRSPSLVPFTFSQLKTTRYCC